MKTRVVIIGAGPAGLLLGHLLRAEGIDCMIVERRARAHVEGRIRAGILETITVELMQRLGLDTRLKAEGLIEEGFNLAVPDHMVRIDLKALTGRHVTVYGQTDLTADLIAAASERGLPIHFEADVTSIAGPEGPAPSVHFTRQGSETVIHADFIAGCDGFHGPSRRAMALKPSHIFEREYPFGWLGILADVPPCHPELIYASGGSGFALASMRSPTRSRYYIQVPMTDTLADWPAARLWEELAARFDHLADGCVTHGAPLEMSIAPLRSFVTETMRRGRLFLAGDAAHIVPPTGAKGLNLAASDVAYLSEALIAHYRHDDDGMLEAYERRALDRIWKAERFSWYMTKLMHHFPDADGFEQRMQRAEFDYVAGSQAMQTAIAENYAGLPL